MREVLCALFVLTLPLAASMDGLGVGVIAGDPTGLTLKGWLGASSALDLAAAWSLDEDESFHLHADYLMHHFGTVELDPGDGRLPLYYGLGGRLVVLDREGNGPGEDGDDDFLLGVRIPLGAAYLFEEAPVEIFLEVVPVVDLVPETDMDMDAALGARVYL
jgi:hypothetical protein